MKRRRSSLVDEDEGDNSKMLIDNRGTQGSSPINISDDTDEDDLMVISGPPPIRPNVSPAQEPPTLMPQEGAATNILDEDRGLTLDELCVTSALIKLSERPTKLEFQMLQESSTPEAISRVEDQASMRAQKRPVEFQSSLVLNTPSSSKAHGNSPTVEVEVREKIMIDVINNRSIRQSFQMFKTDKFQRLFEVYAHFADYPLANLSFHFDGHEVTPNSTPKDYAMHQGAVLSVREKLMQTHNL